jgi:asparagine synthase (glutamine-hydrolysing)
MKIRNGEGKWILRQVLNRRVPRKLVDRPKTGFSVPLDSWLRGALRGWAEDLLDGSKLRSQGHFDPAIVRSAWAEHLSGRHHRERELWCVLMFQAWLDQQ